MVLLLLLFPLLQDDLILLLLFDVTDSLLLVPLATLEVAGDNEERLEGTVISLYSRNNRRSSSLGAGEAISSKQARLQFN